MPAMEAVEESNREHERAIRRRSLDLVMNLHAAALT
jgi:hypothetical protein